MPTHLFNPCAPGPEPGWSAGPTSPAYQFAGRCGNCRSLPRYWKLDVAMGANPPDIPGGDTTINPGAPDDGAWIQGAGFFTNAASDYTLGNSFFALQPWQCYARFPAVEIPQGATIVSATISGASPFPGALVPATVQAIAHDNFPSPASYSDITSPGRTSGVAWSLPSASLTFTSPDIATVIQAIVNRPGWSSGNALCITLETALNVATQKTITNGSWRLSITYQGTPPIPGPDLQAYGGTWILERELAYGELSGLVRCVWTAREINVSDILATEDSPNPKMASPWILIFGYYEDPNDLSGTSWWLNKWTLHGGAFTRKYVPGGLGHLPGVNVYEPELSNWQGLAAYLHEGWSGEFNNPFRCLNPNKFNVVDSVYPTSFPASLTIEPFYP